MASGINYVPRKAAPSGHTHTHTHSLHRRGDESESWRHFKTTSSATFTFRININALGFSIEIHYRHVWFFSLSSVCTDMSDKLQLDAMIRRTTPFGTTFLCGKKTETHKQTHSHTYPIWYISLASSIHYTGLRTFYRCRLARASFQLNESRASTPKTRICADSGVLGSGKWNCIARCFFCCVCVCVGCCCCWCCFMLLR